MGYNTNFAGSFELNIQLTLDDYNYLIEFNENDHRNEDYGFEHSYYCQWKPNKDGRFIEWDGNEKFYKYKEWLKYLIRNFFEPKGYILNGQVSYQGEEIGDTGFIIIKNNIMSDTEIVRCPFCEEKDFNKVGLKIHLQEGHCKVYDSVKKEEKT